MTLDWAYVQRDLLAGGCSSLWSNGFGRLGSLLSREACEPPRTLYSDSSAFRSRIDMAQYRFGRGEYKYLLTSSEGR